MYLRKIDQGEDTVRGLDRKNKRQKIAIAISILILILVYGNVYRINNTRTESVHKAEVGVIDLKDHNLNKDIADLNGEWEFYSGKLIEPGGDFRKKDMEYVKVPGDWETYLSGEGLENGSGTYRLKVQVPEDEVYAIKAKTIRTSYRIYLNGEKVAQAGNPSIDTEEFESQSKYRTGAGTSKDGELEVLIHITSLNYRSGGIQKPIELGTYDSIVRADKKAIASDTLLVAICLTLSIYFLLLYLQRNRQTYLVYFSGVNFFMGLYLSTMNEQVLDILYEYSHNARVEMQIITIVLTSLCFLRFVHHFFKRYSSKKLVDIISGFMAFVLLFSLVIIRREEITNLGRLQIGTVISVAIAYVYMFYILVKAIYRRTEFIEYILIIVASIGSYWGILFIKTFKEVTLGNTPVFIVGTMMFSIAALTIHRLQADYEEAKRLSQKLKKYDEQKDNFFAKASVKFKESLESILESIKSLLEGQYGDLNEIQQGNLFKVSQETEGLRRISDDLMDVSIISNENIELSKNPIDVYKKVEEVLKEIRILKDYKRSIRIKNKVADDFPVLKGDSNKFNQIIYDLLDNALKYTKEGEIIISAQVVDGQGEIKIKDTGIGIRSEDLPEIFDMFYQRNQPENQEQSLGIGLHIVKQLVKTQGGQIHAESVYGEGTTISFTLPVFTEKDREDNIQKIYEEYNLDIISKNKKENDLRTEKILIVENIERDQKLLESIIEDIDCQFTTVSTGQEALEVIRKEKIDLVLLNFMVNDMTSQELCKEIRNNYSMGELPILILTSSGRTIDLISSFDYEVNDFQRKPINPEELQSRIQSLLLIKASAEEGLEKEFQYFYSQISPHFLYNTLNSIIGLSYRSADEAREALTNLSVYLRGKLDIHRKKGFVTLEEELELVTAYLAIEKLRYGEKLRVEYDIEEGIDANLPPLTLQPIIENAVHHGVSTMDDGKVEIKVGKDEEGFVRIEINDNGKGMSSKKKKQLLEGQERGIGFKNVMERIKILKGSDLTLESAPDKGTRVKIIIPEVKKYDKDENNFS